MNRRKAAAVIVSAWLLAACAAGASPTPAPTGTPAGTATVAPTEANWCAGLDYKTVTPGVLTVATYGSGMPVIEVLPDNKLGGLLGLLYEKVTTDCGLTLKLFETEFASMILAVQNGEADTGTYIFYNPTRAKVVYYSYPHYLADRAVMYTRADFAWTGPDSLNGKKVGTVTGFVWAPYLQAFFKENTALFPDQATGGQALLSGQIDGWINGAIQATLPPFSEHASEIVAHEFEAGAWDMPITAVFNESYNIVNCNNKGMAKVLDQALTELVNNGEWQKAMTKFEVPADNSPRLASPEELC